MGSGFSKQRTKSKGKAEYDICSGACASDEIPLKTDDIINEKKKSEEHETNVANVVSPAKDDSEAEQDLPGSLPTADVINQLGLLGNLPQEVLVADQRLPGSSSNGDSVVQRGFPGKIKKENGCSETDSLEKLIDSAIDEQKDDKAGSQTSSVTSKDTLSSNPVDSSDSPTATKLAETSNDPIEVVVRANGDARPPVQSTSSTSTECNTSRSPSDSGVVSEDDFRIKITKLQKVSDSDLASQEDRKKMDDHSSDQGLVANAKFFSYQKPGSPEIRNKSKTTFDDCREINLTAPKQEIAQRETAKGGVVIGVADASLVNMGKKFSREEIEAKLREPNLLNVTSENGDFDVSVYDNIGAKYTNRKIHDTSVKKKLDDFMEAELRFAERRSNSKDRATYLREMRDKIRQKTEARMRKNLNDDF